MPVEAVATWWRLWLPGRGLRESSLRSELLKVVVPLIQDATAPGLGAVTKPNGNTFSGCQAVGGLAIERDLGDRAWLERNIVAWI